MHASTWSHDDSSAQLALNNTCRCGRHVHNVYALSLLSWRLQLQASMCTCVLVHLCTLYNDNSILPLLGKEQQTTKQLPILQQPHDSTSNAAAQSTPQDSYEGTWTGFRTGTIPSKGYQGLTCQQSGYEQPSTWPNAHLNTTNTTIATSPINHRHTLNTHPS
jgi:hypothetical protein